MDKRRTDYENCSKYFIKISLGILLFCELVCGLNSCAKKLEIIRKLDEQFAHNKISFQETPT